MPSRRQKEWFDNEQFWIETYPYMFPDERFERTPAQTTALLKLVKPRGKAVLDLCSGPGRFSVELAKRKFKVTGVDRTIYLMDKGKARARAAKVKVEWVESDMRDFVRPGAFDLAINMFTSFGYFEKKGDDVLVIKNMFESLKPGGTFVIDVMGKERLAKSFMPTTSEQMASGGWLLQRHEITDDWTTLRNEWVMIKDGKARTWRFTHTVYSGQELRDRMEAAGFQVKLYGDLEGSEYDRHAVRLIAVGTKPRN